MSFQDISNLCSGGHFAQCSGTVYAIFYLDQWFSSRYSLKKMYTFDEQLLTHTRQRPIKVV